MRIYNITSNRLCEAMWEDEIDLLYSCEVILQGCEEKVAPPTVVYCAPGRRFEHRKWCVVPV